MSALDIIHEGTIQNHAHNNANTMLGKRGAPLSAYKVGTAHGLIKGWQRHNHHPQPTYTQFLTDWQLSYPHDSPPGRTLFSSILQGTHPHQQAPDNPTQPYKRRRIDPIPTDSPQYHWVLEWIRGHPFRAAEYLRMDLQDKIKAMVDANLTPPPDYIIKLATLLQSKNSRWMATWMRECKMVHRGKADKMALLTKASKHEGGGGVIRAWCEHTYDYTCR